MAIVLAPDRFSLLSVAVVLTRSVIGVATIRIRPARVRGGGAGLENQRRADEPVKQ